MQTSSSLWVLICNPGCLQSLPCLLHATQHTRCFKLASELMTWSRSNGSNRLSCISSNPAGCVLFQSLYLGYFGLMKKRSSQQQDIKMRQVQQSSGSLRLAGQGRSGEQRWAGTKIKQSYVPVYLDETNCTITSKDLNTTKWFFFHVKKHVIAWNRNWTSNLTE